jgi:hypothetical protein
MVGKLNVRVKRLRFKYAPRVIHEPEQKYPDEPRQWTEDPNTQTHLPIVDDDMELLNDLLKDVAHIKSTRKIEMFVAENREYINKLGKQSKANFLNVIQRKYYR